MAACVRLALRSALAVTTRATRAEPNRTHVHSRVLSKATSTQSRDREERTPGHQGHQGHRGEHGEHGGEHGGEHEEHRGEHGGHGGEHRGHGGRCGTYRGLRTDRTLRGRAAVWAALGFSLFGRSEEEERDEAQRKEDEMILLLKKAKLSVHREQMSAAHSFLHQALALAQQLHHQDALVYCYSMMANLAFVRGQLEQAEKLFKAVLSLLLSRGTAENDNAVIETSLKLAMIYTQQNRLDLAERGFRFCVESLEEKLETEKRQGAEQPQEAAKTEEEASEKQQILKDSWLLLGLVLDSRARFWTQISDLARAEQDYRRSLSICSQEQGEEHPQTLVLLSDLATVLDLRGNRSEALVLVRKAVDLGRTQDHPDQHILLCNMAAILLHSGDLEAAARFYHEALALAKLRGDQETVEHIQDGLKELKDTRGQQREGDTRGQQREGDTRGQQREGEAEGDRSW